MPCPLERIAPILEAAGSLGPVQSEACRGVPENIKGVGQTHAGAGIVFENQWRNCKAMRPSVAKAEDAVKTISTEVDIISLP
jgi:hypothetical protein